MPYSRQKTPPCRRRCLDHGLSDGDTWEVCARLKDRDIPFVLYSGYARLDGACSKGVLVHKPAPPEILLGTLIGLLKGRPISN
jgi:hypothetical protein